MLRMFNRRISALSLLCAAVVLVGSVNGAEEPKSKPDETQAKPEEAQSVPEEGKDKAAEVRVSPELDKQNLKAVALAMHTYYGRFKTFPPAAVPGPTTGVTYSWRVELLPFLINGVQSAPQLTGDPVTDRTNWWKAIADFGYEVAEPWDSPHNTKCLKKMPAFYRHSSDNPDSTRPAFFVFTGPQTLFKGSQGTEFEDIADGTSNTLFVVEAKRDIPWTKPEDISYAADKPVPEIGGFSPGTALVSVCDGSVQKIHVPLSEEGMRAAITCNGLEPMNWNGGNVLIAKVAPPPVMRNRHDGALTLNGAALPQSMEELQQAQSSHFWLWFAMINVGLIGVGLVLWLFRRKRSSE